MNERPLTLADIAEPGDWRLEDGKPAMYDAPRACPLCGGAARLVEVDYAAPDKRITGLLVRHLSGSTDCQHKGVLTTKDLFRPPEPKPLAEEELAAIAVRVAAATPGPWTVMPAGDGTDVTTLVSSDECGVAMVYKRGARGRGRGKDAPFIAHSREDVPRLVAEVRHLRAFIVEHAHANNGMCISCGADASIPGEEAVEHERHCELASILGRRIKTDRH